METKEKSEKLRLWQQRLSHSETAYKKQLNKMDGREKQYLGDRVLRPLTDNDTSKCGKKETPHVRNITAELIEAQVSSDIPQPKVTARRKEDEPLAKIIEDMLRNELDRLPMEYINDMQERTVPIQGGSFYHVEWDNRQRTHNTTGEVAVAARHPKQVIPQEGVYTALEDMDYIILRLPTTKERVKAVYGVDISDEGRSCRSCGAATESPRRTRWSPCMWAMPTTARVGSANTPGSGTRSWRTWRTTRPGGSAGAASAARWSPGKGTW